MNKKAAIAAMIASCPFWLILAGMGIRVMRRRIDHPADWHFMAALGGTVLAVGLLGICLAGIYTVHFTGKFSK